MATYKVIQDIEADDKLLGPLTPRQFIYMVIVIVCGAAGFKLATVQWYLALPFLPPMVFFAVLGAPFGHDQPSEVWLLAKVRFFLKPRRRIWDQSGIKELVTITAPKKLEKHLTNELSQTEVRSRLQALANTIDSRGWAAKNVDINMFSQPSYVMATDTSDRLLDPSHLPQAVPTYDVQASDDMLDERSNPTAQYLDQMMVASTQAHKQEAIDNMRSPAPKTDDKTPPADYWFLNGPVNPLQNVTEPGLTTFASSPVVFPAQATDDSAAPAADLSAAEEQALLEKIHAEKSKPNPAYGHLRTIMPPSQQPTDDGTVTAADDSQTDDGQDATTTEVNPAIIELANNDDLNVATIQRQANKADDKKPPRDEVIVRLR